MLHIYYLIKDFFQGRSDFFKLFSQPANILFAHRTNLVGTALSFAAILSTAFSLVMRTNPFNSNSKAVPIGTALYGRS